MKVYRILESTAHFTFLQASLAFYYRVPPSPLFMKKSLNFRLLSSVSLWENAAAFFLSSSFFLSRSLYCLHGSLQYVVSVPSYPSAVTFVTLSTFLVDNNLYPRVHFTFFFIVQQNSTSQDPMKCHANGTSSFNNISKWQITVYHKYNFCVLQMTEHRYTGITKRTKSKKGYLKKCNRNMLTADYSSLIRLSSIKWLFTVIFTL